MKKSLLPLATALFLLIGCAKTTEVPFTTTEVALTAEGPLFEGTNTVSGIHANELAAFLNEKGYPPNALAGARLVGARIKAAEGSSLSNISQVTLSMAAENTDMQEVALLNPVPAGAEEFVLNMAQNQKKIEAYLKQPGITFVIDATLSEDSDEDLHLTGVFDFILTLKQ